MPGLLIVDDEEIVRHTLAHIVIQEEAAYGPVAKASNGEDAISLARRMRPDIVLMDVKMPGLDGLEALRIIRAEHSAAKVVMLTAYDEFTFAQQALKLGAVDYLLKPVRPATLRQVLSRIQAQIEKERQFQLEVDKARDRVRDVLPLVEIKLVADLIHSPSCERTLIDRVLRCLGKTVHWPAVIVVDVTPCCPAMQNTESERSHCFLGQLSDIVREVMPDSSRCLIGQMSPETVVTVVSADQKLASISEIRLLGEDIQHTVKMHVTKHCARHYAWSSDSAAVTVGIGHRHLELESVSLSYDEARRARSYRLYLGKNSVIHIDDVEAIDHGRFSYPIELERELLARVRQGDREGSEETMARLLDHLLDQPARPPAVTRVRLVELVAMLSRAVIETGTRGSAILSVAQRQNISLAQLQSEEEIRAWALDSLAAFFSQTRAGDRWDRVIERAIGYMIQNQHRPDLTLEDVAQAVYFSLSHLSHLFKDRMGVSCIKYLTSLRLEEAKRLLRTTDLTVAAVAEAVGYEVTYFHRVFRREAGVTPAAYRRMAQLNRRLADRRQPDDTPQLG